MLSCMIYKVVAVLYYENELRLLSKSLSSVICLSGGCQFYD